MKIKLTRKWSEKLSMLRQNLDLWNVLRSIRPPFGVVGYLIIVFGAFLVLVSISQSIPRWMQITGFVLMCIGFGIMIIGAIIPFLHRPEPRDHYAKYNIDRRR